MIGMVTSLVMVMLGAKSLMLSSPIPMTGSIWRTCVLWVARRQHKMLFQSSVTKLVLPLKWTTVIAVLERTLAMR